MYNIKCTCNAMVIMIYNLKNVMSTAVRSFLVLLVSYKEGYILIKNVHPIDKCLWFVREQRFTETNNHTGGGGIHLYTLFDYDVVFIKLKQPASQPVSIFCVCSPLVLEVRLQIEGHDEIVCNKCQIY